MPAFLTHWHVLIETARRSQDAGSDLGSLIVDTTALRRRLSGLPTPPATTPAGAVWDTGPLPEIDYSFPGSDISTMAYLGALAPDIPSYQRGFFRAKISDAPRRQRMELPPTPPLTSKQISWSSLLHSNRSGDFILAFLEQIAIIPSPALRSQALAFMLGYISHIATDIALNPWINVLAHAYQTRELPGLFYPLGPHFYIELRLDEYIAARYFEHKRYEWINQPWRAYIEPAAHDFSISTTITGQVPHLLTAAAEATYDLTEEQGQRFHMSYLAGLHALRSYLSAGIAFPWLTLNACVRRRAGDPIIATIGIQQHQEGTVTLEEALAYAIRLSERLCRRAISYYASLRNTNATATERNERRAALRHDLRNWDLHTGYTLEISFEQDITLRFLHNWILFADLWNAESSFPIHSRNVR
jgi:hypothetical protein